MYLLASYIIVVATLIRPSVLLSTFDPQCTQPDETVNVVETANTRGTFDILYLTLPTLFVCTWTVQHLNIRQPKSSANSCSSSRRAKFRESIQEAWPQIMWMLITIIAPEIIIALAFQDWMLVRRFFCILESNGDRQDVSWTKTHVFFANMGGFVLTLKMKKDENLFYEDERMLEVLAKVEGIESEWKGSSSWTAAGYERKRLRKILHGDKRKAHPQSLVRNEASPANPELEREEVQQRYETLMFDQSPGPFSQPTAAPQASSSTGQAAQLRPEHVIAVEGNDEIRPIVEESANPPHSSPVLLQTRVIESASMRQRKQPSKPQAPETEDIELYLSAIQLYVAHQLGLIKALPAYAEKKILDKSKSDGFVKLYALIQVGAFLTRIAKRCVKGLPISQLELAVLAFCLCCFLAYCFYWSKPQSALVSKTFPIPDYAADDAPRLAIRTDLNILKYLGSIDFIGTTFVPPFVTERREPTTPIPNDAMDGVCFTILRVQTHYAEIAAVLAGVAFGALYFTAWSFPFPSKIEMLLWRVSCGLTAGGPILYDIANIVMTSYDHGGIRHAVVLYAIATFYLFARIFLIVEMFRTLFFLPPHSFAA
ncbi:hypothetical protein K458DRAFT_206328 [Lentithecium fluviatile CBS 122367]|uniref:Uncharacterized protein n=1 Tax=Lentithecium fluviatile CBS 122367 TaxID=1168545 RepID=A0A6G1IBY9_9PLEO|nr:hypothetical protein K458DRAFT_206328 [Lentithecium fluviatile CBS 122367]